jgi:tetratricopeptide (TPR) repeat protein
LLLDRRRIRKWAKWVALALAIIFAGGFLFMGIGYGGAGFNLSEIFSGGCTETTEPNTVQAELDKYLAALAANPNDTSAMQSAATVYEGMYEAAGEGQGNPEYLQNAAGLLEKAITVDPSLKDVYLRLADLYITTVGTTAALQQAVVTLNKAVEVDPNNPDVYLKLGTAQRSLGNIQAAALAWQKYLQLEPNGEYAKVIQGQLDELVGNTTTTAGTSTTGGTGTTAGPGATTTTLPVTTTSTSAAATSTTG